MLNFCLNKLNSAKAVDLLLKLLELGLNFRYLNSLIKLKTF